MSAPVRLAGDRLTVRALNDAAAALGLSFDDWLRDGGDALTSRPVTLKDAARLAATGVFSCSIGPAMPAPEVLRLGFAMQDALGRALAAELDRAAEWMRPIYERTGVPMGDGRYVAALRGLASWGMAAFLAALDTPLADVLVFSSCQHLNDVEAKNR